MIEIKLHTTIFTIKRMPENYDDLIKLLLTYGRIAIRNEKHRPNDTPEIRIITKEETQWNI